MSTNSEPEPESVLKRRLSFNDPSSILKSILEYKKLFDDSLYEANSFTNLLAVVEAKTGVERFKLAYGLVIFIIVYLLIGFGASLLVLLVGFVYPAYQSVKAIETHDKSDDTKWLTYWVVFASLYLLESIFFIIPLIVPLYDFFKCIFFIFCMAPIENNGSMLIYTYLIRPLVLKHADGIDRTLGQAVDMAGKMVDNGSQWVCPECLVLDEAMPIAQKRYKLRRKHSNVIYNVYRRISGDK